MERKEREIRDMEPRAKVKVASLEHEAQVQ